MHFISPKFATLPQFQLGMLTRCAVCISNLHAWVGRLLNQVTDEAKKMLAQFLFRDLSSPGIAIGFDVPSGSASFSDR
jgi:hypothetical protein